MASNVAEKFLTFRATTDSATVTSIYWACIATVGMSSRPAITPSAEQLRPIIARVREQVVSARSEWNPAVVYDAVRGPGDHVRALNRKYAAYVDGVNESARDACHDLINAFHAC